MIEREFPAEGLRGLDVEVPRGSVLVRARESGTVRVRAELSRALPSSDFSASIENGVLAVKAGRKGLGALKPARRARVVIEAPAGLFVRAAVGCGSVQVRSRRAPVQASVLYGAARARDVEGPLRVLMLRGRASAAGVHGRADVVLAIGRARLRGLRSGARILLGSGLCDLGWASVPKDAGVYAVCALGAIRLLFPASARPRLRALHALGRLANDFPSASGDGLGVRAVLGVGELALAASRG
ncbi:MAG TPA: hypothetical protein VNI01_08760 [Elusimicrobiota bacterium]|nr:hypothetical protein [Elusimicrobiota bacterium]